MTNFDNFVDHDIKEKFCGIINQGVYAKGISAKQAWVLKKFCNANADFIRRYTDYFTPYACSEDHEICWLLRGAVNAHFQKCDDIAERLIEEAEFTFNLVYTIVK